MPPTAPAPLYPTSLDFVDKRQEKTQAMSAKDSENANPLKNLQNIGYFLPM